MSPLIENVSDTARWVAMYRAQESSRPDALFHDPFAERLAASAVAPSSRACPAASAGAGPWSCAPSRSTG
jgi:O-methyltransferase involved in polyketide biosynthesis